MKALSIALCVGFGLALLGGDVAAVAALLRHHASAGGVLAACGGLVVGNAFAAAVGYLLGAFDGLAAR